uniref:Uncharacterized protein n=1 Tax=Megaselia scalaris TaxID=36166 RepID=T1GNM0_MEGSC
MYIILKRILVEVLATYFTEKRLKTETEAETRGRADESNRKVGPGRPKKIVVEDLEDHRSSTT